MRPTPFELERLMGMEGYLTDREGIGGSLRDVPGDFVVSEVPAVKLAEAGDYLVARVKKENWETHHLLRDLARQLGISDDRIGFAGTKDKRAITTQLMSFSNLSEDALAQVSLPRVEITPVGRANKAIALGDLKGNEFDIAITRITPAGAEAAARVADVTADIAKQGGVPNFFGYQRFGIKRPVTHLIGRHLVKGDLEAAALTYIALSFPWEKPENRAVRDAVWQTRDYKAGLEAYPFNLRYERTMMHQLIERPGNYAGAFRALPGTLMKIFVHAYQSYIFNRMLSNRMKAGGSIAVPEEGDVICFTDKGLAPDTAKVEQVTKKNRQDIMYLFKRKRAFLVLPLVGKNTDVSMIGEIDRRVLDEEGIEPADFYVAGIPELSSAGLWRETLLPVSPAIAVEEDAARARFFLPKGSYATTVLREYMKADPERMD